MESRTQGAPESAAAQPRRPRRRTHIPGLDGLRGLAVLAVIVYHLDPSWLPGGFLGVDVFFVISGYLITSLLLDDFERKPDVRLRGFWIRRARRLLPALVALLLIVTAVSALVAPDAVGRLRVDLPASLLFVMNWRLAVHHDSYVAALGRPPLFVHLWSLAVEEQFYLLWPPLLLLLRRRLSRARVAAVALGAAVASAVAMAVLFHPHADPSGVYFATDTHAEGLLLGCALGALVPPWRMVPTLRSRARRILNGIGLAAAAATVAGVATLGFTSAGTYRGGMFLLDVATAVVILVSVHPASRLGRFLDRQPLRWAGLRSYSLYLWHWPVFELTRPGTDLHWNGWAVLALRLGVTAAAAEASYRLVEQPWRTGRAQAALRAWFRPGAGIFRWAPAAASAAAAVPVAAVVVILIAVPIPVSPAILSEGASAAARVAPAPPSTTPATTPAATPAPTAGSTPPRPAPQPGVAPTTTTLPPASSLTPEEPILAIGDSVLLAASHALDSTFGPSITIDAAVGRQTVNGLDRLAAYRDSGALSRYHTLVIDLGTNGTVKPAQLDQLKTLSAGVPVVVVYTLHAPRPWIASDNSVIRSEAATDRTQIRVADWDHVASSSLLYPDGIHPDAAGASAYTDLLVSSLAKSPAKIAGKP